MAQARGKKIPFYKRRIIVDKRFQFKMSLYFIAVAGITTILLIGLLNTIHNENLQLFMDLQQEFEETGDSPLLDWGQTSLYLMISIFFVVFSSALFIFGIYYSHRIIGPIERLNLHMIKAGKDLFHIEHFNLRRKDYLQHVKDLYNQMLNELVQHNRHFQEHATPIIPHLHYLEREICEIDSEFDLRDDMYRLINGKEPPKIE